MRDVRRQKEKYIFLKDVWMGFEPKKTGGFTACDFNYYSLYALNPTVIKSSQLLRLLMDVTCLYV